MKRIFAAIVTVALLLFGFGRVAHADPVRILVAAGSKRGLPAEHQLKFADRDAQGVRDVLVSLGGVRREHAFYLSEPNRAGLFEALDRARAEAQRHRAEEVTLIFYFSGHGDRDAIHLGSERVLVSELSAKLAQVPASLRVAVTDACRATRDKGFAADEPFAISATMSPQASGQVWLHASSDGEAAQESDELQGAIFTNAWLTGLRGAADANGDARVTLDESFAFAHSQTLIRSAKSSGVMQKPEAVVSLREAGPVVLTRTTARMATLTLPPARDTHFLIYSAAAKSVLSELWGLPDRRLVLRVPPGRYVIQKRLGDLGSAAQIAIAEGEERTLDDRDFSGSALETLARKGGGPEEPDAPDAPLPAPGSRTPHELSAGYDIGASTRTGFVHGPRAAYAYAWGTLALTLGAGLELAQRSLADRDERLTGGFGRAGLELRLPLGSIVQFRTVAGARLGLVAQTIAPARAAAAETKNALALGPEIVLGARFLLSRSWFADIAATGAVTFLREEDAVHGIPTVTGAASLGLRF